MIRDVNLKKWLAEHLGQRGFEILKILDVDYAHVTLDSGDDLYVTTAGLSSFQTLMPENYWPDQDWFKANSQKLDGTSAVYKIKTKPVENNSKDIVLKWNRMGQDIPGAELNDDLLNANFNSPFEEYSLIQELAMAMANTAEGIPIQKPLAIYVPFQQKEFWATGRKKDLMMSIIDTHKEITLDMNRSYAMIFEWIEGLDLAQACAQGFLDKPTASRLTRDAEQKLKEQGYVVWDRKPHHLIVNPDANGQLKKNEQETIPYSMIDFELLERTPQHKEIRKIAKRLDYHKRQKERFSVSVPNDYHPHLHHVNILGVDYIYGHAESTKGRLWVVGKDPYLFDYFLPERWSQVPKTKISVYADMYHVITKDEIHLVWKLSKVGQQPDMDPFKEDEQKILAFGYNSPFEEVSLAIELANKNVQSIYPRAIYMVDSQHEISSYLTDDSRFKTHLNFRTFDNQPLLEKNRDYIIIWGYWNGPDEKLADKDGDYYEGKDILRAYRENIINKEDYVFLMNLTRKKLLDAGIEDLNLRGNHILISIDKNGKIVEDVQHQPEIRLCNFEFLKRVI